MLESYSDRLRVQLLTKLPKQLTLVIYSKDLKTGLYIHFIGKTACTFTYKKYAISLTNSIFVWVFLHYKQYLLLEIRDQFRSFIWTLRVVTTY